MKEGVAVREPVIAPEKLEIWASYLLDHSLGGIAPGERVMVKGERICWPLIEILERRVIAAGGVPDVCLVAPNNDRGRVWSAAMARGGTPAQVEAVPAWHGERYRSMDKYVEVLGAEDPTRFAALDAPEVSTIVAADRPFTDIRLGKRWVITLFPTPAMAEMEQMDFDEYVDFIVRASTTDPKPLLAAEQVIAPLFEKARNVAVVTVDPRNGRELTLDLGLIGRAPMMSHGLRNFPDGEVFTSPDARLSEGEIFLDLTVNNGGVDIGGIYLKLEAGRIVGHSAERGGERLAAIVSTDEGSHRLGEIALGMNPGLDRVIKHPLFVEKVGGTLHVAIGASYEICFADDPGSEEGRERIAALERDGVLNRSAQHVDVVADFRPGGAGRRVLLGETEVVVRGGVWVPA